MKPRERPLLQIEATSAMAEQEPSSQILERFHRARTDPELAVLEGIHPLKHAVRFGAERLRVVTPDLAALLALAAEVAPDLVAPLSAEAAELPAALFARLAPKPPATGVLALARRPALAAGLLLAGESPAPWILLDRVVHLGNLGAAVRVAAAAEAAGVFTTGHHDPWHPEALRGAAGLHFALPVLRLPRLPATDRPLVALHPEGEPFRVDRIPPRAILLFGSERTGLAPELLSRAEVRLRLPMRPGVSSLNLATSVAATLYPLLLAR